jgi:hypothetical protein
MTKKLALLATAALVALLTGCSGLSYGFVTAKTYEASYTYYTSVCTSYDKNGMCLTSVPIPNTAPECWRLDLEYKGETGNVCVPREVFDDIKVGDNYSPPKED